jgi:hypothetical protein
MLQEFHRNTELEKVVHEYLVSFLSRRAVEKVFAREDVSAVAEAKQMVDEAFNNLGVLFDRVKIKDHVDEAR